MLVRTTDAAHCGVEAVNRVQNNWLHESGRPADSFPVENFSIQRAPAPDRAGWVIPATGLRQRSPLQQPGNRGQSHHVSVTRSRKSWVVR
jgi:hypothetical protein